MKTILTAIGLSIAIPAAAYAQTTPAPASKMKCCDDKAKADCCKDGKAGCCKDMAGMKGMKGMEGMKGMKGMSGMQGMSGMEGMEHDGQAPKADANQSRQN